MKNTIHLLLALSLLCACVSVDWAYGCSLQRQTAAKFTINSRRNQTGHWISQVRIEHGSQEHAVSNPWTIEVDQSTSSCDGLESVQLVATLTAPPPRAGPGYELRRGLGYYKMHSEPRNWQEARKICAQEGAHLAIINSEEESQVLQSLFAPVAEKAKTVWAFIGFHDLYTEGQYLTIFDEPLNSTGFYRWASPNQPDNYGSNSTYPGEDCGSVNVNGGLNDLACQAKVPFICEQELWIYPPAVSKFASKHVKLLEPSNSSDKKPIELALEVPPV